MQVRSTVRIILVLLAAAALLFTGCWGAAKTVRINTDPSGATVYLNGVEAGVTPLTKKLSFAKSAPYEVRVRKANYEDGTFSITYDPRGKTEYEFGLKKQEVLSTKLVTLEATSTEKGPRVSEVVRPALAYLETIERSPNVTSVDRITANEDASFQIGAPVLSPVQNLLVYAEYVPEDGGTSYSNLWAQAIDSYAKTRVTYGKYMDLTPCFTPDGQYLVLGSNRASPNQTLWRVRLEGGGGLAKITGTMAGDCSPSVSPDGTRIAYASLPPGAAEPQIWSVDASGTLPTQLREGESPQVSPDGSNILFVRKDTLTGRKRIWLMNIDGGVETQLTQGSHSDATDPRWSPEGNSIVYASDEGLDSKQNHNYDIWLMAVDGSRKTQLTTNGSWDDSPCWDNSGEYVYFRSNRGGPWNIWRLRPAVRPSEVVGRRP